VNPHVVAPVSLPAMIGSVVTNWHLVVQLTKRDVVGRYRGSVMGLLWSFFHPLFMLAVYTFVFSVVFKARWGGPDESRAQFAVVLFAGLIVHNLFAEVINRAPGLILSNANYVKKVVFPLEVLPVVTMGSALFHAAVSLVVLLLAFLLLNGYVHVTAVFIPLVFIPLMTATLGVAWMLASLGVYARDVGQFVGTVTTVLLFLSPVFFPISAVPPFLQGWMLLNPLTFIIEQIRSVLIWGSAPDWSGLALYMLIALAVAWAGYAWFQRTRKGFADVL